MRLFTWPGHDGDHNLIACLNMLSDGPPHPQSFIVGVGSYDQNFHGFNLLTNASSVL